MASGIEAIVGARSDALYGPMLLVGAGGILVELAKDAALRMLPVSAARRHRDGRRPQARRSCSPAIAAGPPPTAPRSRRPRWRSAASSSITASKIADIEINPLMVRENGAVAVDVRVLWRVRPRREP